MDDDRTLMALIAAQFGDKPRAEPGFLREDEITRRLFAPSKGYSRSTVMSGCVDGTIVF
jgi:hypothetical protein